MEKNAPSCDPLNNLIKQRAYCVKFLQGIEERGSVPPRRKSRTTGKW